jgi:hypothetical protein
MSHNGCSSYGHSKYSSGTKNWVYQHGNETHEETYQGPSQHRIEPSPSYDNRWTEDHSNRELDNDQGTLQQQTDYDQRSQSYDSRNKNPDECGTADQSRPHRSERRHNGRQPVKKEISSGERAAIAATFVLGGMLLFDKLDTSYKQGLSEMRKADERAERREARRLRKEAEAEAEAEAARRAYEQGAQESHHRHYYRGKRDP